MSNLLYNQTLSISLSQNDNFQKYFIIFKLQEIHICI